jgi:hypothetical protein
MSKKQKKGGFESKYDAQKLRDLIQSGASADQIQEELGVVSKQSLRQHVLKLINTDRKFYDVPGLYVRNLKRPQINFKGEVRLTKKMLDFPGTTYKHGDQFEIDIDNERIVMTRIVDTPTEGDVADEATEEPEGE